MADLNKETISITLDVGVKERLKAQHIYNISAFANNMFKEWLKQMETGMKQKALNTVIKKMDIYATVARLIEEATESND